MEEYLLSESEINAGRALIEKAVGKGASKVRVTLAKSTMDLIGTLNGQVDKVTHCFDRSMTLCLFIDGKYGSYSTNRIDERDLDSFLDRAVAMTGFLSEDRFRDLPSIDRVENNARSGYELGLYDNDYENITPERRRELALQASIYDNGGIVSEEGEYSDCVTDTLLLDSNGAECRHIETSFEYGVEITVEDTDGLKYSSYHWDSTPKLSQLDIESYSPLALEKALSQIGPKSIKSGKYDMVLDAEIASRALSSILRALNAYSLQQNDSFLLGSLGKKVFPDGMTVLEWGCTPGESGSRLFDSEGVAIRNVPIIENGVVKEYFINTYMAGKMGLEPTVEDYTRPKLMPYPVAGLTRQDLIDRCGEGILVTGFNGGNSNSSTGDFSYGVEGFYFKDCKIQYPLREMVLTGNFIDMWSRLVAIADDARPCMTKLVPSLAFRAMDFSK